MVGDSKIEFPGLPWVQFGEMLWRRVGKQQALAPLASPTICSKVCEMIVAKKNGG